MTNLISALRFFPRQHRQFQSRRGQPTSPAGLPPGPGLFAAVVGPIPGSNFRTRNPAIRSPGFHRNILITSLMWATSRNFEAAVFHERNVAAGQLGFELGAVVGSSEQDSLFQRPSCFPGVKGFTQKTSASMAHPASRRCTGRSPATRAERRLFAICRNQIQHRAPGGVSGEVSV
jgi:hypothetical protein